MGDVLKSYEVKVTFITRDEKDAAGRNEVSWQYKRKEMCNCISKITATTTESIINPPSL